MYSQKNINSGYLRVVELCYYFLTFVIHVF